MDTAARKQTMREEMLRLRAAIPLRERRDREEALCRRLAAEIAARLPAASDLAFPGLVYFPFGTEPDILPVVEWLWRLAIPIAAPRSLRNPRRLEWRIVRSGEDVRPGTWGIREPKPECPLVPDDAARKAPFILVPGVAFDSQGGRLGYGGGYYDRFLSAVAQEALTLAAAFEAQLLPEVPAEEHDVRISFLVTESRTVICGSRHPSNH